MALKKFDVAVREWVDETEVAMADAVIKISLDIYAGVLLRTRVDTGRLRASWRVSLNARDPSVAPETEASKHPPGHESPKGIPASGGEEGAALNALSLLQLGDVVFISNSLPYAEVFNDKDNIIEETMQDVLGKLDSAIEEVRAS